MMAVCVADPCIQQQVANECVYSSGYPGRWGPPDGQLDAISSNSTKYKIKRMLRSAILGSGIRFWVVRQKFKEEFIPMNKTPLRRLKPKPFSPKALATESYLVKHSRRGHNKLRRDSSVSSLTQSEFIAGMRQPEQSTQLARDLFGPILAGARARFLEQTLPKLIVEKPKHRLGSHWLGIRSVFRNFDNNERICQVAINPKCKRVLIKDEASHYLLRQSSPLTKARSTSMLRRSSVGRSCGVSSRKAACVSFG